MKIFKEEQRFTQLWLIVLIVVSLSIAVVTITKAYIENPNNFSTTDLIGISTTILLASSLIFFLKLSTRIDEKGIHYKFFPFHRNYKIINWNEIEKVYVRTYSPLTEYGGWGYRSSFLGNKSKGTALNVSGDIGIQLILKNGKKLLIGTQKQNDAKRVIATYKSKIN